LYLKIINLDLMSFLHTTYTTLNNWMQNWEAGYASLSPNLPTTVFDSLE